MDTTKYNVIKTWVEEGNPTTPRVANIIIEGVKTEGSSTAELVNLYDPAVETGLAIPIDEYMASGIDKTKWDTAVSETKARTQATIDKIQVYEDAMATPI